MDRDVVAAMNVSTKGRTFLFSSSDDDKEATGKGVVFERPKGSAGEAMKGNVEKEPLILRVDAGKLSLRHRYRQPKVDRVVQYQPRT